MPWQPCALADLVQRPFAGTTTWPCEPVTYQGDLPLPLHLLPCPPWLPAHCPSSTRPCGSGRGLKPPPDGHQPHQGPACVVDLGPGTLHIATLLAGLEVLPPASVCHLSGQQEVTGPGDLRTGSPAETEDSEPSLWAGALPFLTQARLPQVTEKGVGVPCTQHTRVEVKGTEVPAPRDFER